jgi:hypothetical protein
MCRLYNNGDDWQAAEIYNIYSSTDVQQHCWVVRIRLAFGHTLSFPVIYTEYIITLGGVRVT